MIWFHPSQPSSPHTPPHGLSSRHDGSTHASLENTGNKCTETKGFAQPAGTAKALAANQGHKAANLRCRFKSFGLLGYKLRFPYLAGSAAVSVSAADAGDARTADVHVQGLGPPRLPRSLQSKRSLPTAHPQAGTTKFDGSGRLPAWTNSAGHHLIRKARLPTPTPPCYEKDHGSSSKITPPHAKGHKGRQGQIAILAGPSSRLGSEPANHIASPFR